MFTHSLQTWKLNQIHIKNKRKKWFDLKVIEYTSTTPIGANFDISENLADIMDLSEADLEDGIAIASLNRNTKINGILLCL